MAAQADIVKMTCKVPTELHKKVMDEVLREESTLSKIIVKIIQEHYENNGGKQNMSGKQRTIAFQVEEELYQQIKAYLDTHLGDNGKPLTQKEFIIKLIRNALAEAEPAVIAEVGTEQSESLVVNEEPPTDPLTDEE